MESLPTLVEASQLLLNSLYQRAEALNGDEAVNYVRNLRNVAQSLPHPSFEEPLSLMPEDQFRELREAFLKALNELSTSADPHPELHSQSFLQLPEIAARAEDLLIEREDRQIEATGGPLKWSVAGLVGASSLFVLAAAYLLLQSNDVSGAVKAELSNSILSLEISFDLEVPNGGVTTATPLEEIKNITKTK